MRCRGGRPRRSSGKVGPTPNGVFFCEQGRCSGTITFRGSYVSDEPEDWALGER